ncbi:MAG: DUF1592 domain-containing protein [Planctomycetota bacterium]|nr:DUF1592 domain-containing protein [Planctomycetota bacterium]
MVLTNCTTSVAAEDVGPVVSTFFKFYCIDCHGPTKQKGDFRVDELKVSATTGDAEHWQLVLDNLHLGEMPPKDAKQPVPAEVEPVVAWIQSELKRATLALGGQKDEVVLRRLNRFEYENTILDLFDVRGNFAVGFPEDAISGGFNNNGAALSLSAEQMNEYLKAADFILNRAIVTGAKPETQSASFTLQNIEEQTRKREAERSKDKSKSNANNSSDDTNVPNRPYYPRFGEDSLIPVKKLVPNTASFFKVGMDGWYRFMVSAYAVRNNGKAMRLHVHHQFGSEAMGQAFTEIPKTVDVIELTDTQPQVYEYRVYLEAGERVELRSLDGFGGFLTPSKFATDNSPAIAVRKIEMEGPQFDQWPTRGHETLLGKLDASKLEDDAVPNLLSDLAPKLFRRPVNDSVVKEYVAFYKNLRAEVPALEAYKLTVKAMMTSPMFLFHYEPALKVDDYALANRLSYFLWRSMPDAELLALAAKGELSNPSELKKQTARLLADAKSERFLKDFTGQWLQTAKVGEMPPDSDLYPEYDNELEQAMVKETELFIRELLVNDLSLANLIDSDWTMLNDRLARHYGIEGVEGNRFRKVMLDKSKTVRGGVLTQASILSATSNGTTTSPVVRGVWLLERLLGTPAPPPPPDVPPIEPDIRGASTIQEQLAKHRNIAQCAGCHEKIDPYGMAMENFDVIGGWRENYRALLNKSVKNKAQVSDGKPVNSADELPRHGAFKNFAEFRALLKKDETLVVHNVAEKLSTFALGRSMGFADRAELEAIVKETREKGDGFKTMIETLIQSSLFRKP